MQCLNGGGFLARGNLHQLTGLPTQFDPSGIDDVEVRAVLADGGTDVPREQRVVMGGVVPYQQDGGGPTEVAGGSVANRLTMEGAGQGGEVSRAVVVEIIGSHHGARKASQ